MQRQCYRPWLGNVASGSIAELDILGRTGGDRTGLGRTYHGLRQIACIYVPMMLAVLISSLCRMAIFSILHMPTRNFSIYYTTLHRLQISKTLSASSYPVLQLCCIEVSSLQVSSWPSRRRGCSLGHLYVSIIQVDCFPETSSKNLNADTCHNTDTCHMKTKLHN